MKNLSYLVTRLTKKELNNLKHYYNTTSKLQLSKKNQLLTLILKHNNLSDETCCSKIYKKKPHSAYTHLKKDFKTDIYNILLQEDGDQKYNIKFLAAAYNCRKKILQAQILKSRGLYTDFEKLIREALIIADEFEMPQEALTCTELLLDQLGISDDFEKFEYYSDYVDQRLDYLTKMLKAKKLIHLINMPQQESKTNNELRSSYISDIQNIIEETGSDRVRFNYLQVMFNHFYKENDFELAKTAAENIQELYLNSPVFYSKLNVGGSYYNIGLAEARLGNFTETLKLLENAVKPFNVNSINALTIKTNLFSVYLNLGNIDKAIQVQQEIQDHRLIIDNPYDVAALKNEYNKAYLYYVQGNYQKAIVALHNCDSLDKLNKTWYWASLILEILILLEQDLFELADARLYSLKRKLQKVKLQIPRLRYIIKVLSKALKNHSQVRKTLVSQLEDDQFLIGVPPSDPFGYEIIAFEKWVEDFTSKKVLTA